MLLPPDTEKTLRIENGSVIVQGEPSEKLIYFVLSGSILQSRPMPAQSCRYP